MKKLFFTLLAAGLVFSCANALAKVYPASYTANVSQKDSEKNTEYQVFFDYENGVWHGAPKDEADNISKWMNLDLNKFTIKLANGDELVVVNNMPAIKNASGVKEINN